MHIIAGPCSKILYISLLPLWYPCGPTFHDTAFSTEFVETEPVILRLTSQLSLCFFSVFAVLNSIQRFHPTRIGVRLACCLLAYAPVMDISSKILVLAVNQYMVMCTQQPSVETLLWHIETTIKLCDGIVARTAVTLLRSQWNVIFSVVRFFQQQRGHLEQIMISDVDYCKNELQRQEIHCDAQNALAIQHVCVLSSELEQYCGINFGQAFDFMSFHIMHDTCGIQLTRNHIVGLLSENGAPDGPIPKFASVVAVDAILTRLNNIVQENRNNGSIKRHVVPPGHVIYSWHQIQQMQEMLFHLVRVFSP